MDIQKLAAEMGLNCITTYKLDALKAVCRRNESYSTTDLSFGKQNGDVTIQNSDMCSHVERDSSVGPERVNADRSCMENGG